MSIEIEETGDLSRTARVDVSGEEFNKRLNAALRELSKDVNLRGFRKGNVPLSVMRKRYGAQAQQDVVQELVRSKIQEVLEQSDQPVIHLGEPEVKGSDTDEEGFSFTLDFVLRPEIDPIGYMGLELEREAITVEREEVDERLEQLRNQYGALEPIEFRDTIEEGDVVTFDYRALGDSEELVDFTGDNAQVEIGQGRALDGLEEGLIGAEFNSTVTVEITPDEHFPVEELRGETFDLEVDIQSVKRQVLPDLDDEFARDTGDAETLLELRTNIREEIEEEREHQAMHQAEDVLLDKLLEQNEFDLPPKFVEEQVERERQQRMQMLQQFSQQGMDPAELGIDPEEFAGGDELVDEVKDRVRADFLLMAIAEKEEIDVDEEDLIAHIEHRARHSGTSPQQLMQSMMQNQEQLQQMNMMALLEKTKKFLVDNAEVIEVESTGEKTSDEAGEAAADDGADEGDQQQDAAQEADSDDDSDESDED